MKSERSAKIIASIGTLIISALLLLSFTMIYLTMPEQPPKPESTQIDLIEEEEEVEEFVEVIQAAPAVEQTVKAPSKDLTAQVPKPSKAPSKPTPASGTDKVDKGPKKDTPPPVVSSKTPSPVKVKEEKPKKQEVGATTEPKKETKKEDESVKRQANNEVANAFKNAQGKHNTDNGKTGDVSNSGEASPNKTTTQGTTGIGSGKVGGGWIIPKYAPVKSTVTGSVKMVVKIDKTGRVTDVSFSGGTPPAATDSQVKAAIEREIRSRKFSRANYDDAEGATAYITYTFK